MKDKIEKIKKYIKEVWISPEHMKLHIDMQHIPHIIWDTYQKSPKEIESGEVIKK